MNKNNKHIHLKTMLVAGLLGSTMLNNLNASAAEGEMNSDNENVVFIDNFYESVINAHSLEELWVGFNTYENTLNETFANQVHTDLVNSTVLIAHLEQLNENFTSSIDFYNLLLGSSRLSEEEMQLIEMYKEKALNSIVKNEISDLFTSTETYTETERIFTTTSEDEKLSPEQFNLLATHLLEDWSKNYNINEDYVLVDEDSKGELIEEDYKVESTELNSDNDEVETNTDTNTIETKTDELTTVHNNDQLEDLSGEEKNITNTTQDLEMIDQESIEALHARATNGSGASARWNASLEGLEKYPNDKRFVSALQAASHNILRLGKQAHDRGDYSDALIYYNRLVAQDILDEGMLNQVGRYKHQAESLSQLENQDDLLQRALSGRGASARWNAALEGLEYYPEDSRFVSALQAASQNVLRLGKQAHERGDYSDALIYYNRMVEQEKLDEVMLKQVGRYKLQAESSISLESQDNLLERALSGSGASSRWNAALEGLEYYPEDGRFVSALQAASQNILRLGKQAHERGDYSDALIYYNRMVEQEKLDEVMLKQVGRYKLQAESSISLESQDNLLERALSGSGASSRWNAALEGLEYYPEDGRFVSALQAASQNILRLGMQAHERGNYSDALIYYNRLVAQEKLENNLLNRVSRFKQQAESLRPLETKESLYNRATKSSGASARWHASLEGLDYYPEDNRFLAALNDISARILKLGMDSHKGNRFGDAQVYYQRLINEPRVANDISVMANKLSQLAASGKVIMSVDDYLKEISSSSSASQIWHLVNEAIFLHPNDALIQSALDESANRQLVLGRNLYRSGDMSGAKMYFNRVISQPMVSQGLNTLASSYYRLTQANYKPTIYIDAGHGGRDSGASFGGVHEKDLNLKTSLYLQEELEKRGYNVLMARTTDVYMDLTARPIEANEINADLFISIHYNSMGGTGTARGIETFIYHRVASGYGQELNRNNFNSHHSRIDESLRLVDAVHSNLIKETGLRDRGIKGQNFNVLRNTEIPAMLTELGFLDNPIERAHVNTTSFQRTAAKAMANGVDQYFGK